MPVTPTPLANQLLIALPALADTNFSRSVALRSQGFLAGGPVHPERGFVLHDGGPQWDSTLSISDELFLTTSRDVLEAMTKGEGPQHAVVALGCAGWTAGHRG